MRKAANLAGAILLTIDNPTGEMHNSAHVNRNIPNNGQNMELLTPEVCARYAPKARTLNEASVNNKPN